MIWNGVLPEFGGIAVHDCWRPYWRFEGVTHATCGAHFLRELTGAEEAEPEHQWPGRFRKLLLDMKSAKDAAAASGLMSLEPDILEGFAADYDRILDLADRECPPPQGPAVRKSGRRRKGRERALIERLRTLKDPVCLYVHDFEVPFDNNRAERDVRNVKTKIKVSGCFCSYKGGQGYLDVMSYLSTGRKHGVNAFEALAAAFDSRSDIVLKGS